MRKSLGLAVVAALFVVAVAACGGGSSSKSAFCDYVKKESSVLTDNNFGSDASLASSAFKQLESKAPSEIKKDIQLLASYLNAFAAAGSNLSSLSDVQNSFSDKSDDLTSAVSNIEKYTKDNCGITLGSDSSSSSSKSKSSSSSKSSSNDFSDLSSLSNFSDLSDLTNLSSLSDYFSSLSSAFSDFSDLTDLSSLSDFSPN